MGEAPHPSGLRSLLANSAWLMLDRVLRMILALLVGAWVARHLGPSRYGELAYGLAMVALWQAIANLGLDAIFVRDLAREPGRSDRLMGTVLRLRLIAGTACWALVVLSTAALQPGDLHALGIVAILGAGLVFQSSDVVDLWFQSKSQSKVTVLPRLVAYCLASAVKIALILANAPVIAFAAAILVEIAFTALTLTLVYRSKPTPGTGTWDATLARSMVVESWPYILAGLSVVVYLRIDQIVLRMLSTSYEQGLYSAIQPFSSAWHIIPTTVCASVLPRISVLKTQDPALYVRRLTQLFSAMLWSAVAVACTTALLAPWLIDLLLGPGYSAAVPALRWHAFTNIFVFLGVAQSVAIVSDGTSRIALLRTLSGAVVSLVMNVALVPQWGAVGAAWSALAAYFCAAMLSNAVLAPAYLRLQLKCVWPFHA